MNIRKAYTSLLLTILVWTLVVSSLLAGTAVVSTATGPELVNYMKLTDKLTIYLAGEKINSYTSSLTSVYGGEKSEMPTTVLNLPDSLDDLYGNSYGIKVISMSSGNSDGIFAYRGITIPKDITKLNITDLSRMSSDYIFFYRGDKAQWNRISINDELKERLKHGKNLFFLGEWSTEENGLIKSTSGKWEYITFGIVDTTYKGIAQSPKNGKWYYVKNGTIDYSFTGLVKSPKNGKWYYCQSGIVDYGFTGIAKSPKNGKWYYVNKGIVDYSFSGLVKSPKNGKWYYCNKGIVDYNYTGLGRSPKNGKLYYCKNGIVDYTYTGKAKDATGREYDVVKGIAKE